MRTPWSCRLKGPAVLWVLAGAIAMTGAVPAQQPSNSPLVQLSAEPLFLPKAKPTLTLLLSVEHPTAGAAYVDATAYSTGREYLGYFDPNGCYLYSDLNKHFVRSGSTGTRACNGLAFSGNFMNWASTSAIDILRYGLTGGDRVVDERTQTVLQRAVIPTWFYNRSQYFASKQLSPALATGAVPWALRGGYTGTIYIANCLNRIFFGTQPTGDCSAPGANGNLGPGVLTSDSFFLARVRVCDAGDAASRPALCALQRSGSYKPVGNLQRHGDRLRVAVFGYLKEYTKLRYGGVLRAPMKYVGPQSFDNDFKPLAGLNPAREWDDTTGMFLPNPDNAAEGISGAINYLNQFGRSGNYKENDPASELYYEALRYLQGLPPTPQAVMDLLPDYKDGFPVYTTWNDPHPVIANHSITQAGAYSCVMNNILGIGDVRTNADKSLPGNTQTSFDDFVRAARPDYNEPDMVAWTRLVGGFETGAAMPYVDGQGMNRVTSNPGTRNADNANLDTKPVAWDGGALFYLVGAAYWANTHDIRPAGLSHYAAGLARPGMRARTYMIDVNEEGVQTAESAFKQNQFYLAAKYGGFIDRSQTGNPFLGKDGTTLDNTNWSRPVPTDLASDGMVAMNYFQGNNAAELLKALDDIFIQVLRQSASIANAAVANNRLATDTALFQGGFDAADWSGDVVRYRLTHDASDKAVIASTSDVTTRFAAAELDKLANLDTRRIFAGKPAPNNTGTATEFKWASLDADQREALRRAPAPAPLDDEATGQRTLAYLRGDRSQEARGLRRRSSRLGDIINSGVVYSGKPVNMVGDSSYASFMATHGTRPDTVFVGANDGMLHAFDATTMAERFAYIPSAVLPNLRELTLPTYVHRSYVDATAMVAEAKVGSAWKTVLVSGLGGGGQGVFALDVSNPASFGAGNVLWEFGDRNDPAMGNVIGRPQLLKLRTSAPGEAPAYKWFAVVASGVNNAAGDGRASSTGNAAIFLLDLAKNGAVPNWQEGTDYFKIELPTSDTTKPNGIVGFSVVKGAAGEVQLLYAGDLQGNLWKLNFAAAGSAQWNAATLSAFKSGTTPLPFFRATDAAGNPQPITAEPEVAFGPQRGTIVAFGTGKFLEPADLTQPYQTQSFYAVLDNRSSRITGRGFLKTASTTAEGGVDAGVFAWGVPAAASQTSVRAGWVLDLPGAATGERQISGLTLAGGSVIFGTLEPPTGGCSEGGGRLYAVDLASAHGSFVVSSVGTQGEPLVMKMGVDTLSDSTSAGRATQNTRYQVLAPGSSGIKVSALNPAIPPQSVMQRSWRQVFNLEQMRHKP